MTTTTVDTEHGSAQRADDSVHVVTGACLAPVSHGPSHEGRPAIVSTEHGSGELRADGSVWNVRIVADMRGRGFGRSLMHAIHAAAKRSGVTPWLYCRSEVVAFYTALGYTVDEIDRCGLYRMTLAVA